MRIRTQIGLVCLILPLTFMSTGSFAKDRHAADESDNGAVILGEAGESYPIVGSGGIKVTGGHHGMWASNMKRSTIEVDGSGIAAKSFSPVIETADFTASANAAYFVSQTSICTLPTAAGAAGQEIVVCNTGSGSKISYQAFNGQALMNGPAPDSSPYINSTTGKVDRFIADGTRWYRE